MKQQKLHENFKDSFKYYKARNPPPDLEDVIDFCKADKYSVKKIDVSVGSHLNSDSDNYKNLGLEPLDNWNVFEFLEIPGLIFIQNPFTPEGQQKWILKCLKDYPTKPSILNIDAHDLLDQESTWWGACFGPNPNKSLLTKLRWATLGYHHNWNTKMYSEDLKSEMPEDLMNLTSFFAKTLNFRRFKAEAAIINYYRMNSTLAGHTDHSEIDVQAPLFSISFGQTAVFLIGGPKQEDPANAVFLRSGDVIVMSNLSRLRYHGVPKIINDEFKPWESSINSYSDWCKAESYIKKARINLNVRQVLMPGQLSL